MSSSVKRVAAGLVATFATILVLILVISVFDLKRLGGGQLYPLVVTLVVIFVCVIGFDRRDRRIQGVALFTRICLSLSFWRSFRYRLRLLLQIHERLKRWHECL